MQLSTNASNLGLIFSSDHLLAQAFDLILFHYREATIRLGKYHTRWGLSFRLKP